MACLPSHPALGVLVAVSCSCWRHWCGIQLGSAGGWNEMALLEPCNISCWIWDLSLCSVTIPKMVIKAANLPQGFPLLLVFCPQEFESREDCRRAAPSLLLKPAFRDNWRLYPQGRRTEQVCPQYSAVQHQLVWVLWLVWGEMEQHRSRGKCPLQNREVRSCCLSG